MPSTLRLLPISPRSRSPPTGMPLPLSIRLSPVGPTHAIAVGRSPIYPPIAIDRDGSSRLSGNMRRADSCRRDKRSRPGHNTLGSRSRKLDTYNHNEAQLPLPHQPARDEARGDPTTPAPHAAMMGRRPYQYTCSVGAAPAMSRAVTTGSERAFAEVGSVLTRTLISAPPMRMCGRRVLMPDLR